MTAIPEKSSQGHEVSGALVGPDRDLLMDCYHIALEEFINRDLQLLASRTHEQAIAHRLAMYLEQACRSKNVDSRYVVDCEYNRNGDDIKRIAVEGDVAIRADLILHSRGSVLEQDNLLAIELKVLPSGPDRQASDRQRLMAMTRQDFDETFSWNGGVLPLKVCGYRLGIYLLIDPHRGLLNQEIYADGNLLGHGPDIDVSGEVKRIRRDNLAERLTGSPLVVVGASPKHRDPVQD